MSAIIILEEGCVSLGTLRRKCQNEIRSIRYLLGKNICEEKMRREPRNMGRVFRSTCRSNHCAGEERKEGRVGRVLDCNIVLRKFWPG